MSHVVINRAYEMILVQQQIWGIVCVRARISSHMCVQHVVCVCAKHLCVNEGVIIFQPRQSRFQINMFGQIYEFWLRVYVDMTKVKSLRSDETITGLSEW